VPARERTGRIDICQCWCVIQRSAALVMVLVLAVACSSTAVEDTVSSSGVSSAPSAAATDSPSPAVEAPYTEREVQFDHPSGTFSLAGTLTVPSGSGPFPAVVLISGAGSQDRNYTIGNNQPQRELADGLARRGVVVLRFDDRGTGESGGEPFELSGATMLDLADDAHAAVSFLADQPEVILGRVGVIGHSEGGKIAPVVANRTDIVAYVVMLAGPAVVGADLVERQTVDILRAEGAPSEIIDWTLEWRRQLIEVALSDKTASEAEVEMRQISEATFANAPPGAVGGDPTPEIEATIELAINPWFRFSMAYDPVPALQDLQVPVLALLGGLDVQVSAETHEPALEDSLQNNPNATVVVLDGLNHMFQPAITGARSEYDTLGEPFDAETITLIADWIDNNT
jgi:pimeloyl-ACP methyl ester carboxylesterase